MTRKEALEILKYHQRWGLGSDIRITDSKKLTEAIDIAVNTLEKYMRIKGNGE